MNPRTYTALLFGLLTILYYFLGIALILVGSLFFNHRQGPVLFGSLMEAYGRIVHDSAIPFLATLPPSLISGFCLGRWMKRSHREFWYKLGGCALMNGAVAWVYYFLGYCIYVIIYPGVFTSTAVGGTPHVQLFGNLSTFSHYILYIGSKIALKVALLQTFLIGILGGCLVLKRSRRTAASP